MCIHELDLQQCRAALAKADAENRRMTIELTNTRADLQAAVDKGERYLKAATSDNQHSKEAIASRDRTINTLRDNLDSEAERITDLVEHTDDQQEIIYRMERNIEAVRTLVAILFDDDRELSPV